MSDDVSYELLGFDNVLLPVGNLGAAVEFYGRAGIPVTFRLDEAGIALLKVGKETPGLLLRLEEELGPRPPLWASARVWLEVRDARATADALTSAGIRPLAPSSRSPPAGPSRSPTPGATSSASRTTASGPSWAATRRDPPHPELRTRLT